MKKKIVLNVLLLPLFLSAQNKIDTIALKDVHITGYRLQIQPLERLSEVHETYLVAGKKNEVINVQDLPANLAEKTARQIFAKIPGAFVYDMDGSGNQVNIATRGLDPHRSWDYNIRQNGVVTNSDIYGYPASHYSPPMEAIKKVELVRGTASLQYGAEFGGMINYVTKEADTTKNVSFESINSTGSYGLFSSFNALGGKIGKLTYYGYYQKRVSDGYRKNAKSNADAQFLRLIYDFNPKISLKAELGRSAYVYQIPGQLTDAMFYADPRQATRSRNYFNPDIYVPSLHFNCKINENTTLNWISSAVLGSRNSVQFEGFADKVDAIDPKTGQYAPRSVDIDNFNSYTSELRLLHHYQIGNLENVVASGIRYFNNDLHRRQQGKGTTGSDFDLSVTSPIFGRDLHFKSQSIAFFVENLIYITSKFTVSPGIRYETGESNMSGYIGYLDPNDIPNTIKHSVPLLGVNFQYKFDTKNRIYGGISQAYRPVVLKDIISGSMLERVNKNLKDADGYNIEVGVSGEIKNWLHYDLNFFNIQYNNRLGNLLLVENGVNYIYKTNIGNNKNTGIELYAEATAIKNETTTLSLFSSTAYLDARYKDAKLAVGSENQDISGNYVESAPKWITRNGINANYKIFSASLQYSYTDKTYSDPTNTIIATANGAKGLVPAYGLWDFNTALRFAQRYILRIGINNLTNKQYFTKRPLFYPGPGIWSSDGRSIVVSLGIKI